MADERSDLTVGRVEFGPAAEPVRGIPDFAGDGPEHVVTNCLPASGEWDGLQAQITARDRRVAEVEAELAAANAQAEEAQDLANRLDVIQIALRARAEAAEKRIEELEICLQALREHLIEKCGEMGRALADTLQVVRERDAAQAEAQALRAQVAALQAVATKLAARCRPYYPDEVALAMKVLAATPDEPLRVVRRLVAMTSWTEETFRNVVGSANLGEMRKARRDVTRLFGGGAS